MQISKIYGTIIKLMCVRAHGKVKPQFQQISFSYNSYSISILFISVCVLFPVSLSRSIYPINPADIASNSAQEFFDKTSLCFRNIRAHINSGSCFIQSQTAHQLYKGIRIESTLTELFNNPTNSKKTCMKTFSF